MWKSPNTQDIPDTLCICWSLGCPSILYALQCCSYVNYKSCINAASPETCFSLRTKFQCTGMVYKYMYTKYVHSTCVFCQLRHQTLFCVCLFSWKGDQCSTPACPDESEHPGTLKTPFIKYVVSWNPSANTSPYIDVLYIVWI